MKGVSCITLQKIQFYSSNDIDSSEILSSNYSVASDFLKWTSGQDQKQIISSRSFPEKYISYNDIYAALCSNLSKALLKLRRLGKIVRRYSFYVKAGPFNQAVYFSDVVDIGCYSNDDILFFNSLKKPLKKLLFPGLFYIKSGVVLEGLLGETAYQQDIFSSSPDKFKLITKCIDQINTKWGACSILPATIFKHRLRLGTSRPLSSPSYLSNWSEIPIVK